MHTSPSEREAHVALWRESGLSRAAYCRENDLHYQTFVSWVRSAGNIPAAGRDRRIEFVEMIDDRPADVMPALCVRAGRVDLHFAASAPAAWVGEVIQAVVSC